MLSRNLAPALTTFVVVSGLLAFLSCEIDAKSKPEKIIKTERKDRPSKCCKPGYIYCGTTGPDGCDCCGASVKGTLTKYEKMAGELKLEGLDDPIPFVVENGGVNAALEDLIKKQDKQGQFILKLKPFEYKMEGDKPRGKAHLTHWIGTQYECEDLGDAKGKMKDRTAEFIDGWKLSGAVLAVQYKLEELVSTYEPERDGDKRP